MIDNHKKSNYSLFAILSFSFMFFLMIGLSQIKNLYENLNISIFIVYIFSIILLIPIILIFLKFFNYILKISNINLKETKTGKKSNILKMIVFLIMFNLIEGFLNLNNISSEILQSAARSVLLTIIFLIVIRHYETNEDATEK